MDLWEREHHASLVRDAEAKGADRKGRAAFSGKEENDAVARNFTRQCSWEIPGRPSVGQPTGRGEGVSSWMTNA